MFFVGKFGPWTAPFGHRFWKTQNFNFESLSQQVLIWLMEVGCVIIFVMRGWWVLHSILEGTMVWWIFFQRWVW